MAGAPRYFTMEVYTQDDFIVALMAISLRDTVDDAALGFFEVIAKLRTEEEKRTLLQRAEDLLDNGAIFPTKEKMKDLSEIWTDLPRNGWELLEIQNNAH